MPALPLPGLAEVARMLDEDVERLTSGQATPRATNEPVTGHWMTKTPEFFRAWSDGGMMPRAASLLELVVLGVLALTLPLRLGAQDTILVSSPSECAGCSSISSRMLASLGSVEDPVGPHTGSWVAFDGEIFVVAPVAGSHGRMAVYSREGDLIEVRGQAGEGPGEFPGIYQVGFADTLWHVVSHGRITYLDRHLTPVASRVTTVSPFGGMLALPDALTVLNGWRGTPQGAALPLHVVDGQTGNVRSFGRQRGMAMFDDAEARQFLHRMGPSKDSRSFWSAPAFEYAFDQWDADGAQIRRIEAQADWFQPRPRATDSFAEWPGTIVTAIRQDPSGLLWVATVVPKADWRPRAVPEARWPVELPDLFDTRIEVFSLDAGELIARGAVPGLVIALVDEASVVRQRRGDWDETVLDILQLTLESTEED
jgi:hypothetical protein